VRTKAPIEIKEFIENNEAYSRSGKQHVAEGGNYITENENRALKSHLPPGVPTLKNKSLLPSDSTYSCQWKAVVSR
jgi:hypothetical protein